MEASKDNKKVLFVLFLGVLMGALDIAIVGPALRPIREAFDVSSRYVSTIFTAYVLMNLVGMPILAKLADTLGQRVVYLATISIFAAGSLLVAMAPSFYWVIAGRAIQGFGAGGIFPIASAVIGDVFPKEKQGRALGLIGAVFGIAFIIGPMIGGILLWISWRAIFLVNMPIAAVLLYLAFKHIPERAAAPSQGRRQFDIVGTLFLSMTLGCFVAGISLVDTKNFMLSIGSPAIGALLGVAVFGLVMTILVERRTQNPVIAPLLFSSRQFNIAHVLAFGAGLLESAIVFVPSLAATVFHVTDSSSSFMVLPAVGAVAIGAPLFGRGIDAVGAKKVIMAAVTVLIIGLLLLSGFTENFKLFFFSTFLVGLGMSGLIGAPLRFIILQEAGAAHRSSAQAVMSLFISSGQLIGAAVMGAVLSSYGLSAAGFSSAYLLVAIFSIAMFVLSMLLKNERKKSTEQQQEVMNPG